MKSRTHDRRARPSAPRLADDIRASLHEALGHAAGKRTGAVVHKVTRARSTRAKRV
jgi:hypothetical protein